MSSDAKAAILSMLRATGGPVAAKAILERLGWALAPSNVPKSEALTPLQRLRNVMADLEYLDQVQRIGDTWQALDRWGKLIEKPKTVRVVAALTDSPVRRKGPEIPPEVERIVREKVTAGWGVTAISCLLKVSPSVARGYIQQVKDQTGSSTSSIRA